MTRLPTPGQDSGQWGAILNDFLSQTHTSTGTLKSGVVSSTNIQDNTITTTNIQDGAITTDKIASNAVTSTNLTDNSIPSTKLDPTVQSSLTKADSALQTANNLSELTASAATVRTNLSLAAASHAHTLGDISDVSGLGATYVKRSGDTGAVDLSGATVTLPAATMASLALADTAVQLEDPVLAMAPRASVSARPLSPYAAFLGDSITVGTGAASGTKYTSQLKMILGSDVMAYTSVDGGVAGNTSSQILARVPAILAASPPPQLCTLLCGTNDSTTPASTDTYIANVLSIAELCRNAGVTLIVGTVPPREAADTTANAAIRGYNLALRSVMPAYGIRLADVYAALVDPATGALAATNDSGDGTHPSVAGHLAIAQAFAAAITDTAYTYPWPVNLVASGLLPDPLQAGTPTTYWTIPSGCAGSNVAAVGGDCPYGAWTRFTVNNSGGGSTVYKTNYATIATGFSDGDILSVWLMVRGDTADSINKVQVCHSGGTILQQLEYFPSAGPHRIIRMTTVPTGATNLSVRVIVKAAAAATTTVDVACVNIFNHTTGGYTDVIV